MSFLNVQEFKRPVTIFTGDPKLNLPTGSASISSTYVSDTVPAGATICKIGNVKRYLPRTKTTAAITSASTTSFTVEQVFPFAVNDVLYIVEPHAVYTLSSFALNETSIITINGVTLPTLTGDGVLTAADAAAAHATNINTSPKLAGVVYAIASGASVYIFAYDAKTPYAVAESGTATAAFAGAVTALAYNATAIGTVAAVTPATKTVLLSAAAGVTVPVGCNIGLYVNEIVGIDPNERDYSSGGTHNVPFYATANGVYKERLPYFDGQIDCELRNINFVTSA